MSPHSCHRVVDIDNLQVYGPGGTSLRAVGAAGAIVASLVSGACAGDCDGDGRVEIDELILGVTIAVRNGSVAACPTLDTNGDGVVAINEVIAAVNKALNGCGDL